MADIRVKDLNEAAVPGADYYLLTDSATDGVKKVLRTNVVKPADIGAGATASPLSQFAATTSAQLASVISDETGSGALVFATSPTLVTPTLGAASATSINKVTITQPLTGATITIPDGVTVTGPAASDTLVGRATTDTLTNKTISGTSNTLSNIGNSSLTNSSMTIAGHSVALGGAQAIAVGDLSSIADGTIASNVSGASAAPAANSISSVLDKLFGMAQGTIVYRDASGWSALTPGTSGNFLKTQGPAANPVWASVPGGGDMLRANNLSDVLSVATARSNLSAAASGANSDITSLSGLTTPLSNAQGGLGNTAGAWTTFSGTPTATSGTFTSASYSGSYYVIGKLVHYTFTVTVTTVGTASGTINVPLPVGTAKRAGIGSGGEVAVNGKGVVLRIIPGNLTQFQMQNVDNTSPIAAGTTILCTGIYEMS